MNIINIELSDKERDELIELLESRVSEIGPEIHHANDFRVKGWLRDKRTTLTEVLRRLQEPVPTA